MLKFFLPPKGSGAQEIKTDNKKKMCANFSMPHLTLEKLEVCSTQYKYKKHVSTTFEKPQHSIDIAGNLKI